MFVNRLAQGSRYFEISSILYFLFILILINKCNSQEDCHYLQKLEEEAITEYFRNPNYPGTISGSVYCIWEVYTWIDRRVSLNCQEFTVPSSLLCATQSFNVYTNPKSVGNLVPQVFCGSGSFSLISTNNTLRVIYRSTLLGGPARFNCALNIV
ncbi:CUB and zona pellucida-like domain-containing protein 1 [Leptopilina boulardi]|uniref:CUB and zona pellucida-like domain-containing protein 1 n=1 Tax=Leptopilina boulardi TaxID=63433 RepID=UPI0021F5AA47|nr:CUB and zona pellucida-like domain-containing protein 1 [Leptopilina boulardi]